MVNTILQPQMATAPPPDEVKAPSPYKIPGRRKDHATSQSSTDQGGYSDPPLHIPIPYSWRMRSQGNQEPGLPPNQSLNAPAEMLDTNGKGKRPEDARCLHKPMLDATPKEPLVAGLDLRATIQGIFKSGDESTIEPGSVCSKFRTNNPDGGLSQPDIKTEESDLTDAGEGTIPLLSTSTTAMEAPHVVEIM
jgi:hypothetical protein